MAIFKLGGIMQQHDPPEPYLFMGFVYDMQYCRDQCEVKEYNRYS